MPMLPLRRLQPLQPATDQDLAELCKTLWRWQDCSYCSILQPCVGRDTCPWHRFGKLKGFFDFYKGLTRTYVPDFLEGSPALRSHEDVFNIAKVLGDRPQLALSQLMQTSFEQRDAASLPPITDQSRALAVAIRVVFMVEIHIPISTSSSTSPLCGQWTDRTSVSSYLTSVFSRSQRGHEAIAPLYDLEPGKTWDEILPLMSARKLKKIGTLKLLPTDDLAEHLLLDKAKGVVKVFHHFAFLKEHLHSSVSTVAVPGITSPV